jgi:hypothetical protein
LALYCSSSYAAVFQNEPTLTASVHEHLGRARKILRRGRLSELLYAAIELRFALERMAQRELVFADMASKRMLKDYDPVKKLANLHRFAPEAAYEHEIYLVNRATGERSSGHVTNLSTRVALRRSKVGSAISSTRRTDCA